MKKKFSLFVHLFIYFFTYVLHWFNSHSFLYSPVFFNCIFVCIKLFSFVFSFNLVVLLSLLFKIYFSVFVDPAPRSPHPAVRTPTPRFRNARQEIIKELRFQGLCEIWTRNSIFAKLNDIDNFMKTILVGDVTERSRPA